MKTLLLSIPSLLAMVGALAAAAIMTRGPDPSRTLDVSNFFVLGALALFIMAAAVTGILLIRSPGLPSRALGGLSLLSLAFSRWRLLPFQMRSFNCTIKKLLTEHQA